MRKWWDRIVPGYSRPWLIGAFALNIAVFWGTRALTADWPHYSVTLPWDSRIPLVPAMVVIYALAYAFWAVNYVLIARESPEKCREVMRGEIIAKLLCGVIFLAFPTVMEQETATGHDIFSVLLRQLLFFDEPNNLFPSIHCLESWLCWRGLFGCRKVGRGYKAFSLVFALAVFASTLLVRQHLIADIPGGVIVGEIGLWASYFISKRRRHEAA